MLKKFFALVLSLLIVSAIPLSVSAGRGCHGGGNRTRSHSSSSARYRVCNFDDCEADYNHKHNSNNYYGHYYNDGHDYHQQCSVSHCTDNALHSHDDVSYMPRDGYHHSR